MSSIRENVLAALERFRPRLCQVDGLGLVGIKPLSVAGFSRIQRLQREADEAVQAAEARLSANPGDQAAIDALTRAKDRQDPQNFLMIAECVVDETGQRLLTDQQAASLPIDVAGRLVTEINKTADIPATGPESALGNSTATRC
jgi:hypothetical protein